MKGYKILPGPVELDNEPSLDDLFLPLGFKQHLVKSVIKPLEEDRFPKHHSGIIFGPPGTGKTTILKALAKNLKWNCIEMGPQDFVGQKLKVEEAITTCFDEIKRYVKKIAKKPSENGSKIVRSKIIFIFDEIDELVVTRDAGTDRETRFVTTMMLPLFQELRDLAEDKFGFIFFVLTNHIERFDPAIKRMGRFDLVLPLGPPDHQARYRYFEKCMRDLDNQYRKKYNLQLHTELNYEISYPITVGKKIVNQVEPVHHEYTNFDVVARASHRLSLSDIKAICDRVVDRRIAMEPNLRKNRSKDPKLASHLYIQTRDFIDWINKFRNSDPSTQTEIEKFYKDSETYARGSTPYSRSNTVQEMVEHEFSSLIVKHNLAELDEKWKSKTQRDLIFSFRNAAEFSTFNGKISMIVTMKNFTVRKDGGYDPLLPGTSSPIYELKMIPPHGGKMEIEFTIEGIFYLRGSEAVLDQNSAELSGKAVITKEITIK